MGKFLLRRNHSYFHALNSSTHFWNAQLFLAKQSLFRLYDRLINTAQIVQIHTLEWTAAILNTDFIHESLIGQWYGKLSPRVVKLLKDMNISIGANSFPSHIGNPPDYRGVPFSLTEEFVSVYRMHSLLPDTIAIRQMNTGKEFIVHFSLFQHHFNSLQFYL